MDPTNNNRSSNSLLMPILLGGAFIVIGGLIIGQATSLVFPDQSSAESEQIDTLFQFMLVIGGAIFLLVQGLLLYSIIRFRKRDDDPEEDGPTVHGNTTLELVWTAIPSVIVLVLVIYSYQVWVDIRAPRENETTVYADGARFAWTFEYEDPRGRTLEGEDEVARASAPELHTYAGQNVVVSMQTQDVIHSFWVPELRVKQDLLPGRTTEVRFTAIEPDGGFEHTDAETGHAYNRYRVVCTELCGSGHGNMWAHIYIYESEEAYMTVMDTLFDPVFNPPADPVLRGAQVVQAYPCAGCHMLDDPEAGIQWAGQQGPALDGLGDRAAGRVAGQTAGEYIYNSMYHPNDYLVAGYAAIMPMFQPNEGEPNYMPVNDVYAITAYLCSLTSAEESACDMDNVREFIEADTGLDVTFGMEDSVTDAGDTVVVSTED